MWLLCPEHGSSLQARRLSEEMCRRHSGKHRVVQIVDASLPILLIRYRLPS